MASGKGIAHGKRDDLSGGRLIRSAGGWEGIKELKKERTFQKSDERILGDGDFVEEILRSARQTMEKRYAFRSRGFDLAKTASRVAEVLGVAHVPQISLLKHPRAGSKAAGSLRSQKKNWLPETK